MPSKFKSVADAQFWYFENWETLKVAKNATNLKRDAQMGSMSGWKRFVKAGKKFHELKKTCSHEDALQKTYEIYPIRLVPPQKWFPTKGTPGLRKGPKQQDVFLKKKTGPKSKFSTATRRACFQIGDRQPNLSNDGIAQRLNERDSQGTMSQQSQTSAVRARKNTRKTTLKGKKKIDGKDVSKLMASGLGKSSKNKSGNKTGVGRIKRTFKKKEKRPRNWVPEHRASFLKKRTKKNLKNVMHIDTTNIKNKTFLNESGRAPAGKFPILKENEKTFGTGTGYTATSPGDANSEPWSYCELEMNKYKCVGLKKKPPKCPHGDDCGPNRPHGSSGTAAIHYFHLKKQLHSLLKHRGITKKNKHLRKKKKPTFIVQLDKSTCQTVNTQINKQFGYKGILRPKSRILFDTFEKNYNIKIKAEVQFTHGFDVNAQDTMFHAALKLELKNGKMPKNSDHLQILFKAAAKRASNPRTIQKGFVRAYSRDQNGDKDLTMVPQELNDWYSNNDPFSSDEEETDDLNISSSSETE